MYVLVYPKIMNELTKVRKKAKIRIRYNQAPHQTQVITRESKTYTIKHHTQESQEVSPFPAGYLKATMNWKENTTSIKHK